MGGDRARIETSSNGVNPMNLDVLGPQLHHRSTLDEPLSAEEQVLLDTWYAEQDAIEAAILAKSQVVLPDLNELQGAIDRTLTQLNLSVQQLQTITQQNESLRQENAKLKQQLSFPKTRNGFGILKGKVAIADGFNTPLDEFADYQ
jgi:hypothetical protein